MASKRGLTEAEVTDQVTRFLDLRGWRLVRNQAAFVRRYDADAQMLVAGMQVGERGMPDWTAIRYLDNGVCLLFWLEMKREGFTMSCRCKPAEGRRRAKVCTKCAQAKWRETERLFSRDRAVMVRVSDFQEFVEWYRQRYQWLHEGDRAEGQMELVG